MIVRHLDEWDVSVLYDLDPLVAADKERRGVLYDAAASEGLFVAVGEDNSFLGWCVMTRHFFGRGFVELLFVRPEYRREGVGVALLEYAERYCWSERIFTSTNLSNLPMQALLAKRGYELSGVVQHLDEGDPELFYSKRVREE